MGWLTKEELWSNSQEQRLSRGFSLLVPDGERGYPGLA